MICDRSQNPTIDRTIDRRVPRLIYDRSQNTTTARMIDRRVPRLIYDRSQTSTIDRTIDRLWLPLVVRFQRWILPSQYATASGDRSTHCRSVARSPNRNQSYDQAIVRSCVTVALPVSISQDTSLQDSIYNYGIYQ